MIHHCTTKGPTSIGTLRGEKGSQLIAASSNPSAMAGGVASTL